MPPARVVGRLVLEATVARVLARFPRRLGREEVRVTWVDRSGRPVLELRRFVRQRGDAASPVGEPFTFAPEELGGLLGAVAVAHGAALAARRTRRHPKEQRCSSSSPVRP